MRRAGPGDRAAIAAFNRAVAEVDGAVRACLLVTFDWSDWRKPAYWWICCTPIATMSARIRSTTRSECARGAT